MAIRIAPLDDNLDFPAPVAVRQAARLGDATTPEGKAVADAVEASRFTVVQHGGNPNMARPIAAYVLWVGWVEPLNRGPNDGWERIGGTTDRLRAIANWEALYFADSLDAAEGVSVNQWMDLGTNGRHLMPYTEAAPGLPVLRKSVGAFGGRPMVEFNNSPLTAGPLSSPLGVPLTVVFVGEALNFPSILLGSGTMQMYRGSASPGAWRISATTPLATNYKTNNASVHAAPHCIVAEFNGVNSRILIDNTVAGSGTSGSSGQLTRLDIGGSLGGAALSGKIGLLGIVKGTLTQQQLEALHGLVADHYGLAMA